MRPESNFTGGILGQLGINILSAIIVIFSFGLAVPWAVCIKQKWIASHTFLDGRPVVFDGTGLQLFGNYIKWFLLIFITFGIYSFWLSIKMQQWVTSHTHLE